MTAPEQRSAAYRAGYASYEAGYEVWQNEYGDVESLRDKADDWRSGWLAAAAEHERRIEDVAG